MDFELSARMRPEQARAALCQREGRLRGRSTPDGGLVLFRRGGFMNDFVRTRATLARSGAVTIVTVRSGYGPVKAMLMGAMGVFALLGPAYEGVLVAVTRGVSAAAPYMLGVVFLPLIWALVIAGNYSSARSEAKDLRQLIEAALNPPRTAT